MYLAIQIHLFRKLVIVNEIENDNKFALKTTAIIERYFKSEYLFRTCSAATKSGDVIWIFFRFVLSWCALPSQLRNSSVKTYFQSDSRAATSSGTRKYGTAPERLSGKEEQDSINVSKRCAKRLDVRFSMKSWVPCIISFNLMKLLVFSYYGKSFDFLFILVFIVSVRE